MEKETPNAYNVARRLFDDEAAVGSAIASPTPENSDETEVAPAVATADPNATDDDDWDESPDVMEALMQAGNELSVSTVVSEQRDAGGAVAISEAGKDDENGDSL